MPGWKLHSLSGDHAGYWAVWVNGNWRLTFTFDHGDAIPVNYQEDIEMSRMHHPPHPGEVLRDGVFTDTGITVTAFAKRLGVTRVALSNVLNGKAGISAGMAIRLAAALGGSAESWLHMQANYDLWQAEKQLKREILKIEPLAA